MARRPTPGNWHDKTPAQRRAWIEERDWSPGGLRSIMAEEVEANEAQRHSWTFMGDGFDWRSQEFWFGLGLGLSFAAGIWSYLT